MNAKEEQELVGTLDVYEVTELDENDLASVVPTIVLSDGCLQERVPAPAVQKFPRTA